MVGGRVRVVGVEVGVVLVLGVDDQGPHDAVAALEA